MSQLMLSQLTKEALLGTERHEAGSKPIQPATGSERLDIALNAIPKKDPTHELLASAGVLAIHAGLGGMQLTTVPELDMTLPPEPTREECPAEIAELFELFRRRGEVTFQRQMLEKIIEQGWRLPPESIPDLLKIGTKNNLMRAQIVNVLDGYGRWLAAKNRQWHYALIPELSWDDLIQLWTDSSQQVRLSILTFLRKTDPEKGLALLESRWPDEPDANRHSLLVVLKNNLSLADEPFIEQALDARQVIVRRRAQELLAMLEESRFCKRMQGYAQLIFKWHTEHRPYLTVKMPVRMSGAMVRDGLKDQTEKRRVDFVSRRVVHVVSNVPVDYWSRMTGLEPTEFVQLVQNTTWPRTFLGALATAAVRQKRSDWAQAILEQMGISPKSALALQVISEADVGPLIQNALIQPIPDGKLTYTHPLYLLLKEWKRPWPKDEVLKTGQTLANYVRSDHGKNVPSASLRGWLTKLISSSPPQVIEQIETMFTFDGEVHSLWQSAVEKGLRQNESKRQMDEVFAKYLPPISEPPIPEE